MAKNTKNYNLTKPETTDFYDVEAQHNANMDKIDLVLKNNSNRLDKLKYIGNKNLLINGCFDIWQRGKVFNGKHGAYTADKWRIDNHGNLRCSVKKALALASDFTNSLRIERYSETVDKVAYSDIVQPIENFTMLRNKKVTFTVNIKADSGVKYNAMLYATSNNHEVARIGTITGDGTLKSHTASGLVLDNINDLSLYIRLYGDGLEVGKGLNIQSAKLELGEQATPIERKTYAEELRDCQSSVVKNKNLLINGCFDVWQRGTMVDVGKTAKYSADRWKIYRGNYEDGLLSSRQEGKISKYGMRVQRKKNNTTTQPIFATYSFESVDASKLRGNKLTLSFYAKGGLDFSDSAGLSYSIYSGTGTDESVTGIISGQVNFSKRAQLSSDWQKYYLTLDKPLPFNINQIFLIFGYNPVGTAGGNDYFDLSDVKLELGEVMTLIEDKTYAEELRDCQRYYFKSDIICSMVQPQADGGGNYRNFETVDFPSEMRIAPTIKVFSAISNTLGKATANYYNGVYGGVQVDSSGSANVSALSKKSACIDANHTKNTYYHAFKITADAEL